MAAAERCRDLLDSLLNAEAGPKAEGFLEQSSGDSIIPLVRVLRNAMHFGIPSVLADELCQLGDAQVGSNDVKVAPRDEIGGRFQAGHVGVGRVAHVKEWPPLPAATHNRDLASSDGVQSHRIDRQVEPHPGRDSKQSRLPQGHRVEGFGGQLKDFLLGIELGLRIQGNRVQRGILGQEGVPAGPINAARRRIQEPLHPSFST